MKNALNRGDCGTGILPGAVSRACWLEAMERRQLMAGVVANLDADGTLRINGTELNDWVIVSTTLDDQYIDVAANTHASDGLILFQQRFDSSAVQRVELDTGGGDDLIFLAGEEEPGISLHVELPIAVHTGAGNDGIHCGDNYAGQTINMGPGNDFASYDGATNLDMGEGDDDVAIQESAGPGTINLGDGNDSISLENAAGVISISGGAGNDLVNFYDYSNPDTSPFDGGPGIDTIDFSGWQLEECDLRRYPTVENVVDFDRGILIGNDLDNEIRCFSDGYNLTLYGMGGNDTLYGTNGDDLLVGGAGQDALYGGDGDDRLISRDGEFDQLFGGEGTDAAYADNTGKHADSLSSIEFSLVRATRQMTERRSIAGQRDLLIADIKRDYVASSLSDVL